MINYQTLDMSRHICGFARSFTYTACIASICKARPKSLRPNIMHGSNCQYIFIYIWNHGQSQLDYPKCLQRLQYSLTKGEGHFLQV